MGAREMKQKTSKLQKLERNRKSILTEDLETCYICNGQASEIHEIYSGRNRKKSIQDDFCVPVCRRCHQLITLNYGLNLRLKMICQEKFEETHTREEFIKIIGKNYLD